MPRSVQMSTDQLLNEIERQQKYLDALPEDFRFPLFNTKRAVESQRQNGYRNTAAAAREIVDNAFEAGATKVHIITDERQNNTRKVVSSVAFIDSAVVFCHCWRPCDTLRPSPTPCVKGQRSHAASHRSACPHRDRPRGHLSRSL